MECLSSTKVLIDMGHEEDLKLFGVTNQTAEAFYQTQSRRVLKQKQQEITVHINKDLNKKWKQSINKAFNEIFPQVVPGIKWKIINGRRPQGQKFTIEIKKLNSKEIEAFAEGTIFDEKGAEIFFHNKWPNKDGTQVHEILHTLGFNHEQQRHDRDKFVEVDKNADEQYEIEKEGVDLTRFDPYSIMLYPENEDMARNNNSVWKLKKNSNFPIEMSALDKVGTNMVYNPAVTESYKPKIGKSGFYYCGRKVMRNHNIPFRDLTDGFCGPDYQANCPSCRVLKTPKAEKLKQLGKWQGWSGMVYCGKYFGVADQGHDGICGPDSGPSCPDCISQMT